MVRMEHAGGCRERWRQHSSARLRRGGGGSPRQRMGSKPTTVDSPPRGPTKVLHVPTGTTPPATHRITTLTDEVIRGKATKTTSRWRVEVSARVHLWLRRGRGFNNVPERAMESKNSGVGLQVPAGHVGVNHLWRIRNAGVGLKVQPVVVRGDHCWVRGDRWS
jgi:hypothetical protein